MPPRNLDGTDLYATVGDCERGVSWSEGTAGSVEREEGREEDEGG